MEWIKLEDKLPPKNTLVLVKIFSTKVEKDPIYFGMRQDRLLSINPDASRECFWYGSHINTFLSDNDSVYEIKLSSNFSDVTVKEWAYINIETDF